MRVSTINKITGWVLTGLLCLAAGCVTKPKKKSEFVFFPPPPNEPRIQYLTSFGSESDLAGQSKFSEFIVGEKKIHRPIWKPYGITTAKGFVYVCDTQPCNVGMVDLVKRSIRYLKPEGRAAIRLPIGIAVDQDGTRYVTDTGRNQVLIYAPDNSFIGEMGKRGEMRPCGIALSGDRLYVTDLSNHCVRVYNKLKRELLFTLPKEADKGKGNLYQPTNVAVDEKGQIYVADTGGFAVHVYDAEGRHLRALGSLGLDYGKFALPKGVGVDREGRIYVVDAATGVVQLFDAEGRLLMFFGEPASGSGALYLPAGLAIDYANVDLFQKYAAPGFKVEFLILVTNQAGPNKVGVYGFLRKS